MGSEEEKETMNPVMKMKEKVEDEYKKIREHAETYPYVWASYIFVYGGLALWGTYRWRKLRNTEARVRVLQEKLRKIVQAEETASSSSSSSTAKPTSIIDKPQK
ncbi:Transmembrane protein [Thalictrum thalictroides]|uniref:Transmembrane protein n=1 Tax=Thalictrum thalictroides TaxID=46969 RepID=A0A7J6UTL0_THATH|nr:Transmembrane protein [Thalictrum thalictroides]